MVPIFVGLFGYIPKEGCCGFGYLIAFGIFLLVLYLILEMFSPKKKKVKIKRKKRRK